MPSEPLSELMQSVKDLSDHLDKPKGLKIELDLQSPYQPDGTPRTDLPTGEVLAWDGTAWIIGYFNLHFVSAELRVSSDYEELYNVVRFAPLPTIYEDDTTTL